MNKNIEKSHKSTPFLRSVENDGKWFIADADGKTLGRFASELAKIIRGKNNPKFTPNSDTGDHVIVINAEKVKLTGNRMNLKDYKHHSLYPGGQKIKSFKELISKHPDRVIRLAVRGMLPKTKLGNKIINHLKVYAGTEHPHASQKPEAIQV